MGEYFPDIPDIQRSQMGDVKTNPTLYVAEEVFHHFPVDFLWGKSQGDWGYHPLGLALDFSGLAYGNGPKDPGPMNYDLADNIAKYLWITRSRLRVRTIIWNRRIISTSRSGYAYNKWTTYRRNDEDPHTDHVHVDFYDRPYIPPKGFDEMTPEQFLSAKVKLSPGMKKWFATGVEELSVGGLLGYAGAGSFSTVRELRQLEAKQNAMTKILEELLQNQGLDPETAQRIITTALDNAVAEIKEFHEEVEDA